MTAKVGLPDIVYEFLCEKKPDWSGLFGNVHWVTKLAYLADIFASLNELNTSMQGKMASCFTMADKIEGHKRKLEAWKSRVSGDCFDMFHNLAATIIDAGEVLDVSSLRKVITEHLTNLIDRFEFYFPREDDPRIGTGWIRNPFIASTADLSVTLQDKLLDLSADEGLKIVFQTMTSLASFWINVKAEYPELAEIALKVLLPFPSTYLRNWFFVHEHY